MIADALYWRKLDYVLVIPEGTDEVLSKGEVPELSCMKVPDCFDSAYFEAALPDVSSEDDSTDREWNQSARSRTEADSSAEEGDKGAYGILCPIKDRAI